jgi:hypothetical protein
MGIVIWSKIHEGGLRLVFDVDQRHERDGSKAHQYAYIRFGSMQRYAQCPLSGRHISR